MFFIKSISFVRFLFYKFFFYFILNKKKIVYKIFSTRSIENAFFLTENIVSLKLSNIEHVQCCETKKNCANVIFFDGASYRPSASKSNFGGGGFFFILFVEVYTGSSNKIGKCIEHFFYSGWVWDDGKK